MYSIHYIIKKILFPRSCLGCNTPDSVLCASCLALLPLSLKVRTHKDHRELHVFPYTHKKIAKIIWELKYKNNTELREILFSRIGPILKKEIGAWLGIQPTTLFLISVPKIKNDTLKNRDFDHGKLLAQALIPYLTDTHVTLLDGYLLKKDTARQATQKNRTARLKSMKEALSPTDRLLSFKPTQSPLIIIDDVTTTGATREEMIRVLKKSFQGEILFIALAH